MPPTGSRVELYGAVRRDARLELSRRALHRKHGVGYRTVTAALESAWPEPRKKPGKRGSRLGPYRPVIDGWLRADLDAPPKQRHTAKRIFDRLLDEHQAVGVVSYGMVRGYVATRRREIRVEAGREPADAFVPQDHEPGREADVDFGDVALHSPRPRQRRDELPLAADRLDAAALKRSIAAGAVPALVVGSAGTLNTGAIDPLDALADVVARRRDRFRVDALPPYLPEPVRIPPACARQCPPGRDKTTNQRAAARRLLEVLEWRAVTTKLLLGADGLLETLAELRRSRRRRRGAL